MYSLARICKVLEAALKNVNKELATIMLHNEGVCTITGLEGVKIECKLQADGKMLNIIEGTTGANSNFPCFLCKAKKCPHKILEVGEKRSDRPQIDSSTGQVFIYIYIIWKLQFPYCVYLYSVHYKTML